MGAPAQPRLTLKRRTATGRGRHSTATSAPGLRSPRPNLTATGLTRRATSASGPGSPLLHLQRERTRPLAISGPVCAGNGLTPATSANGTGLAWRQLSMPYCAGVTLTRRHGPGDVPRALCGSLRAVAYCEYSLRVYCEWEDIILDSMSLRHISYEFLSFSLSVFSLIRRTEDDLGRAVVARGHDCRVVLVFERRGAERAPVHGTHVQLRRRRRRGRRQRRRWRRRRRGRTRNR